MDQNNYTRISLVDLFAYFVKKFWTLFIGALVGMTLLLSYHYISSNSEKKVEAYEKRLSKYKTELSSLESTLDNQNLKLAFLNEVESVSPFFSDEQIYVSSIMIAVDSDKVGDYESVNNAIGQELVSFWNSLDLATIVGFDLDNDVLKASCIFEQSGLSATIRVYSEDKNKAERYASSIVDAFITYYDTREHLSIGSKAITTSVASKSEIANNRDQIVSDKSKLLKTIFDTEEEIKALTKQAPSKYHPLKNAVIGFLVGGIVVGFALFMNFVFRNPVTSSFYVEKELGELFLGSTFTDNGLFSKLARRMIGEREFTNNESVVYLKNSFSNKSFHLSGLKKTVTLISSLKGPEVEKAANEVIALLKEEGFEPFFIDNSSENPLTIKTVENNEAVILFERQWSSKMQLLRMNKELACRMDKKVLGFVLC